MKARSVLDASALLAFMQGEPGADVVERAIKRGAVIGAANWSEVLAKLSDKGIAVNAVLRSFRRAPLASLRRVMEVRPVSVDDGVNAARIRFSTMRLGLSMGDRLCLALGRRLGQTVITSDRAWSSLRLVGVRVRQIR